MFLMSRGPVQKTLPRARDSRAPIGTRRPETKVDGVRRSKSCEWNTAPGSVKLNKESSYDR